MGKIHDKIKQKQQKSPWDEKKVAICIPSRGEMEIGTAFDLAVMCAYDSRHREGHQATASTAPLSQISRRRVYSQSIVGGAFSDSVDE